MEGSIEELHFRKREGKIITKKTTLSQEVKRSIYLLIFTLLAIIVLLSIVFLLNTSQSTQKGYILKKEQLEKEDFLLTNRDLINKIIDAQAFKSIQNNPLVKKMLQPDSITYIKNKK